jgi:hypothetical protein
MIDTMALTACSKVLGTVELLELVALNLSCQQVLVVCRVSKQWRSVICGSLKLQVALCNKPSNLQQDQELDNASALPSIVTTAIGAMPGKTYNNYKVKWHFAPSTLTQLTASSALDT